MDTKEDPSNPDSSILYVAAPIIIDDEIAGVLTVAKPTTSINSFLHVARKKIKERSIVAGFFVILLSVIAIYILIYPIKRITQYADRIREGEKADLPKMDKSEIGDMGRALENMRKSLEGKNYVERYVQTLTHEIKSPLSGIKGAAELLEEDMAQNQRMSFLNNIQNETLRIEKLVDRMLALSSLEGMNTLTRKEKIRVNELMNKVTGELKSLIENKNIRIIQTFENDISIIGDPFLIKKAISNLFKNALDFSPTNGRVKISASFDGKVLVFSVEDQGPGIADFAKKKIFDKFFSMRRPDTGQKSTGLGLNFVKEIAELHHGSIEIENAMPTGSKAILTLSV